MTKCLDPFRFVLMAVPGCMNQPQLELIDYLRGENRVRREQLGQRRLRFNEARGIDRHLEIFRSVGLQY